MSSPPDSTLGGRRTALVLALLSAWYLAATLPHLADFPLLDWAQMGIAAPAHELAADGVYGNDLFAGYHRSELRNYEYMPAYPLLVALSFELFGLGVVQARLASVLCGWLTLLLTFHLGRQLYGIAAGLLAAVFLATLRLGQLPHTSGVALLDFARVIRYDVLVPVFVLAACSSLVWAARQPEGSQRPAAAGFLGAGLAAGLATLAHVYGAFVLVVLLAVLLWHRGWRTLRGAAPYLVAAGWLLALLPWAVYVLQDVEAYLGQMSRHQGRFDLLDPGFYWHNLFREPWRYAAWSGGSLEAAFLAPRVGFWLVVLGIPTSSLLLWRRARRAEARLADRLLFLALPLLELCLALLIALKRYYYTSLVMPFIALQLAWLAVFLHARARARGGPLRYAVPAVLVLAAVESGVGVVRVHEAGRRATPYLELGEAIARPVPAGSRLLISQPYWLALKRQGLDELRSVNLLFSFPSLSTQEIMERVAPDFVVIESYFLEADPVDPRSGTDNLRSRRVFSALAAYLGEHCDQAARHPTPDYGAVEVWDCRPSDVGQGLAPEP